MVVTVKRLVVITDKGEEFIDELEALCKKYTGDDPRNYWLPYTIDED